MAYARPAAHEILVGVFGRAGKQRYYNKREMVSQIGFVLCDLDTCDIRKVGVSIPTTVPVCAF